MTRIGLLRKMNPCGRPGTVVQVNAGRGWSGGNVWRSGASEGGDVGSPGGKGGGKRKNLKGVAGLALAIGLGGLPGLGKDGENKEPPKQGQSPRKAGVEKGKRQGGNLA